VSAAVEVFHRGLLSGLTISLRFGALTGSLALMLRGVAAVDAGDIVIWAKGAGPFAC
jgi:hypothetical protein